MARASQGDRDLRSSVRRKLESSDGGGLHRSTRIGAGGLHAFGHVRAKLTTAVARSRARPTEGVSGRFCGCALNQRDRRAALAKRYGLRARRKSGEEGRRHGKEFPCRRRRATGDVRGHGFCGSGFPSRRAQEVTQPPRRRQALRRALHPQTRPKLSRRKIATSRDGTPRREPSDPTREIDSAR